MDFAGNLEVLKYADLRKLAKEVGIKANQKAEKLLKALKEHYKDQHVVCVSQQESSDCPSSTESSHFSEDEGKDDDTVELQVRGHAIAPLQVTSETRLTPRQQWPLITSDKRASIVKAIRRSSVKLTTPIGTSRVSTLKNVNSTPLTSQTGTPNTSSKKRKRSTDTPSLNETFEKSPADKRAKRSRNTFDKITLSVLPNSGAGKEDGCFNQGTANESSKDIKNTTPTVKSPQNNTTSNIPRFVAFAAKKKEENAKKMFTPGNKNWAKIHERNFSKMDSIDVYLAKKRKRADTITASMKKATATAKEAQKVAEELKNKKTPVFTKQATTKSNVVNRPMLFKSPAVPFVPTVTSTAKINTNFASMKTPQANTTSSKVKPDVVTVPRLTRKSAEAARRRSSESGKPKEENIKPQPRKSIGVGQTRKSLEASSTMKSTNKSSPFGHQSQNLPKLDVSQTKPAFNLKASLDKPVTWKMYTGKLKPLEKFKSTDGHKDLKNPKILTRDERRSEFRAAQKRRKQDVHMKNRVIR